MISSIFPIRNGICLIDGLTFNNIIHKGRKHKPRKFVSVHNLVCTKSFHLDHSVDLIAVVSPALQQCERYDRSISNHMHVLCTAVAENSFLSKYCPLH